MTGNSNELRGLELKPKKLFLHYSLWTVQILLALAFGIAGCIKMVTPIIDLATMMPWTTVAPPYLVRFIGISEFAAALGLILPSLTRIKPVLTPWAATGLLVIMIFAIIFHMSRGEFQMLPANLVLAALAFFVAYGRFRKAPIASRH